MLPLSSQQIKATYAQAMKLLGAGKIDEAEKLFNQLYISAPKLAEVPFQLGRIALLRKQPQNALGYLSAARKMKPQETAIWQMMAQAIAAMNNPSRAKAFIEEAKEARLPANLIVALQNRVGSTNAATKVDSGGVPKEQMEALIKLVEAGKSAEAEARAKALKPVYPDAPMLSLVLANALFQQQKLAEAEKNYQEAIRKAPNYPEAHNTYGRLLIETGRIDAGIKHVQKALSLKPKLPLALQNLGIGLARMGNKPVAVQALRDAIAAEPKLAEAQLVLARLLTSNESTQEAIDALNAAIRAGHKAPIFYARLADAHNMAGNTDKALENYNEAVRRGPDNALVHALRGMFFQSLAKFEDAEKDFRKAIALEPRNGEHYRTFLTSHKVAEDDPLIAQMEQLFVDPTLPESSKMHMGFALSRAHEQLKHFDQVFPYLNTANAIVRKLYPYNIQTRLAEIESLKKAFDGIDYANIEPAEGASDFAPIFVTGMPRSGTTLVEQILASHSRVDGAGEVGFMTGETLRKMVWPNGQGHTHFSEISDADCLEVGRLVEEGLRRYCPDAERITDKAIQTYLVLGAIKKILPKSHIVVVHRDPRDTLISIYKNLFPEGTHRYAYNQKDMGVYYRTFVDMVDFWRERMPGGFYEITYENLIDNTEEETRKLLAACDLEFEEQCLRFHESDRNVRTLSVGQVRQPIYKTSQAAWKRYEADIQDMIQSLGDLI